MELNAAIQFRDDELVTISRFDKKTNQYTNTIYPKVGGRLRLAHEENQDLTISTEIVSYDQSVAVITATVITTKGKFTGLGMASVDRDQKLAAAILELAETRAIARSLRFAGYGVEYTGAEEISHLPESQGTQANQPNQQEAPTNNSSQPTENGNGHNGGRSTQAQDQNEPPHPGDNGNNGNKKGQGGNGKSNGTGGNASGNGRITNKQLEYIVKLGKNLGMNSKDLDQESVKIFGIKVAHLKVAEASSFIQNLNGINN
ncbi:MAG: hypothetical protein HQK56_02155 [Deltaproteobacteria bacterium]|nr:hypothetical protein [Deltaproteobacteria bacterium]